MNDEEIDIKLPDKLKETPFDVPNGYFDSLPNRIMEKCTNQTIEKRPLWKITKPLLSFAAGFLLLFGISKIIVSTVTADSQSDQSYVSQANEVKPILSADEMNDDMADEIISYLVDEHYISMAFIEDEYTP
jgi:hypothetical protein